MDLVQCTKQTLYKDPYLGHISLGLQKSFSNKIQTACAQVVGMNIELFFNEEYYNKLNDKQQIGLMVHELSHVCLFHLVHWDDYADKELFNIAADMVINQYIEADYLPPNAILPSSFPELKLPLFKDTKEYYELLKKAADEGTSPKLNGLLAHMKSGGMTVCSHPLWGETVDADGKPMEIPNGMKDLIRSQIEHQIKQVYEENLKKNPGSIPGHLRDLVLSLYMKTPPVLDWKTVVRQFKSYCDKQVIKLTRNKPNKRFPDFDAVTLRQQRKMLVGIDVSGSISQNTLVEFYTQIGHMAKQGVQIDICTWDYGIQQMYEFNIRQPHPKGKDFKGGGGTNPYEVVEYLNKSRYHNACVMLTDGYIGGSWDKKVCKPILWVCNSGGSTNFAFPGKKIIAPNLH